jgi:hypothetical protein
MDFWLIGLLVYIAALLWTFRPTYRALQQKVVLNPGGDSFDKSPYFSEEAKEALQQHYTRINGTLGYWKNKAAYYESLHSYCLFWTIPSAVLIPILTNGITEGNCSRLTVTVVSAVTAILLSFHKGLKVENNFKSFRHGESEFYDLYRRLLDSPQLLGENEKEQIENYFRETENIRRFVRNAETDNLATLDEAKKQLKRNN